MHAHVRVETKRENSGVLGHERVDDLRHDRGFAAAGVASNEDESRTFADQFENGRGLRSRKRRSEQTRLCIGQIAPCLRGDQVGDSVGVPQRVLLNAGVAHLPPEPVGGKRHASPIEGDLSQRRRRRPRRPLKQELSHGGIHLFELPLVRLMRSGLA